VSPGDLNTQLLINMGTQLAELQKGMGHVTARLDAGAETHKRFEQQLDIIDRRTDITETKVVKIDDALNPEGEPSLFKRVSELEIFKSKIGASVLVAGTIVGGALSLIYAGVWWMISHWNDLKTAIRTFFH